MTGVLVLPVKIRPGGGGRSFDFSQDVSVGTTGGWRMRVHPRREMFASAVGGIALSSVRLDSLNTGGVVRQGVDRAAFTWTLGVMLDVDRFQFGAFVGQDQIPQPNQTDWDYHGEPWFGIGLGYTLLSSSRSSAPVERQ